MSFKRNFGAVRQRLSQNRITEGQAREEARIEARMSVLTNTFSRLAQEQPSVLYELASSQYDDTQMVEAGLDLVGMTGLQRMVDDVKARTETEQVSLFNTMNPVARDALVSMGWKVPTLKQDRGLLGDVMAGVGGVVNVGVQGTKMLAKPVVYGLKAMDWLGEEASRPQRVTPLMDSQRRLMTETGMGADEIKALTGIDVSQASTAGNLTGRAPGINDPIGFLQNPGDAWKALRTYWQIGHEGDDDYLATVQYEVYEQLEEAHPGQGKDALRWLKKLANGDNFQEIAEDEGLTVEQTQPFIDQLGLLQSSDVGKKALARLASGRVSYGRTLARAVEGDWDMDTTKGTARWLSGSVDAFYQIAADPTMVTGKITKGVKASRWAVETFDQLHRFQYLARVADGIAKHGDEAVDLTKAFENVPGRGWKALDIGARSARLKAEAKAVWEPAALVSEAIRTGDWHKVVRRFPGFETSIKDIQKFNAALVAAREPSMADDVGQVFEFYKHNLHGRSVLGTLEDDTLRTALRTDSYKLFGHDGLGAYVVPHATGVQRQALNVKGAFGDWFWGRTDDLTGIDDLTEHAKAVRAEVDETDKAAKEVAAEESLLTERALSDNAEEAAAARARLQEIADTRKAVAEGADDMEIDPVTLGYVTKKSRGVREQVRRFATAMTKQVPHNRFVLINDQATMPEDFRRFSDMVGFIKQEPRAIAEARYNKFIAASSAERHAMVQKMIIDMGDATGITETAAGREILRKHISKNNQVYGFHDLFQQKINGQIFNSQQAIFTNQLADAVSIPDFREMLIASRNLNKLRWLAGGVRNSHAEALMTKVWKPLTMMRMGFPLRAGADEALQFMGRVGAGAYGRERILQRWAGLREVSGELVRDANGEVIAAPQAAFAPIRSFMHGIATVAGVTDEALEFRIKEIAYANPNWTKLGKEGRQAILEEARNSVRGDLPALPKAILHLDEGAKNIAAWTSKTFQKVAGDNVFLSRAELAKRFLKQDADYADRLRNYRLMLQHPYYEQAYSQMFLHAYSKGASDIKAIEKAVNEKVIMMLDPSTESGARAVKMSYSGDWSWVGHDNLGTFMHHYDQNLRHMAQNPAGRASMRAMSHYVPQSVVDEISREFKWASKDVSGLDLLKHVRTQMDVRNFSEAEQAAVDTIFRQLRMASSSSMDDVSFESLPDLIKQLGLPDHLGTHPLLAQVFGSYERLSPKARMILFRGDMDMLTTNLGDVRDRAVNYAYNEMRAIKEAKNIRKMVQGAYVDGKPVATPLAPLHTRVYLPMIDRRGTQDLVTLLSDPNKATEFAEVLAKQLRSRNLMGEAESVWGAMVPQRGYDLPTWMAGLKAQVMQNGANYVPAGLAGSTNYALAEALRDTFAEVIPGNVFRPTIGYIDHPDDLFDATFGVVRQANSKSVLSLDSYATADVTPLDPDDVRRLVQVEYTENGERVRRWVGPEEVEQVADLRFRAQGIKRKRVYRSRAFTRMDRDTGQLRVNGNLIKEDWRDGMTFLKGGGGNLKVTGSAWEWTDPDMADAAERMDEVLDGMGLGDLGYSLHDLVGQYKTKGLTDVVFTDQLKAHGLWDDFTEIAADAKRAGRHTKEEWVDQATRIDSTNVKQALEELGIDTNTLKMGQKRYEDVIVNRAKAMEVLRPAGRRRINSLSREAVEMEKDALTYAWRESGLPLTKEMNEQLAIRGPKTAMPDDFKMLGEIFTNGVTEEMAVRRAASNAADEVSKMLTSSSTNEPMLELIYPLLEGDHAIDNILRSVSIDDLPTRAYGPELITGDESTYMRTLRNFYDGVADPVISDLARKPMNAHHFHQDMKFFQPVHDMLVNRTVDDAMKAALSINYVTLKPMDETLRPINEHLYTMLKRGQQLDDEEAITRYAKSVFEYGQNPSPLKENEVIDRLAEVQLGRPKVADPDVLDPEFDMAVANLKADGVTAEGLHQWHMMRSNAIEEQVHRASIRAMERTAPFVDNHRQRSMFQEFLGPVFLPFYYAEELFLRRFARGIYETPHMLRKGQLTMNGLRHMGVVRKDETTGQEVMVIPGSDIALETVASVAAYVTGNEALKVDFGPLSMRTEFLMPGWNTDSARFGMGPLVGLAMEGVTRRYPETAWAGRTKRSYWEYLVPGSVANGYKMFAGQPEQVMSAEMSAITYLEANGHGLPQNATATQTEEYLENVRSVTRAIGAVRWATSQLFVPMTPVDESAKFRKEFADLLGQGVSYEAAVEAMINEHGPNGVIYTIFGSDNLTGAPLPSTADTYKFMAEHVEMFEDAPEAMAWLLPQPKQGDAFDYRAFNESLVIGLRERRTPEEFLNEIRIAQASPAYYDKIQKRRSERKSMVERKASRDELDRFDAETKAWKTSYLNQHPLLAESFSNDASERRKKVLKDLPLYIASGVGGEQAKAIKPLLDLYSQFDQSYSSYAGQSSKAAKALKQEIYDKFYTDAWLYVQKHPETMVFWSSVIEPELPDNKADVESTKVT